MHETLYRIPREGKIFGVCAGMARYFDVDVTLVRLVFVILAFVSGGAVFIAYLVLAMILPEQKHSNVDNGKYNADFSFQEKVQELGHEFHENHVVSRFRNYFGIGLILFGALLLLQQIFPNIITLRWDIVWPVFLMAVGVMVIVRRGHGR